ncbi:ABC transporter [Geobacillus sp. Sah69]|uniref:ABC-type polysaccharide/polyol phosphate transport system, ATPase component n=1 Tax=Geobacillus kaustophilus GBlys TaxID=1337888 RepID=U2WRU7_GEOKU|nr:MULTISPECIES: ABC transporter ATP-binding protein [Geobacillus]KQC47981.1 ABC transporter [Geobacillus sp. Sah69]GAD13506.1 ABC-type polysaccharide/polyol phosphate transport system, ATPase component [Geobacillus kaustophilus GBlys]
MSSDIAIKVENLSKIYQIYDKPIDRLKQSLFRGRRKYYREFVALNNISFQIRKGETVGIIGKNGSGKSTLLQILAGTLTPTSGSVEVNGRVAALLELGSGFNPEFTGRENVYMNGAILGISKEEMDRRFNEIAEFADIGDFIDQPVKTYSSGMYVRLAFAVAINVDADILIVDEALAVGDMQFQLKCIEKMKQYIKNGKTILFVSHDTYQIRNFCDKVIWLMEGEVEKIGDVIEVTTLYENYMKEYSENNNSIDETTLESEKKKVTVHRVYFEDIHGRLKRNFNYGDPIKIVVEYSLHSPIDGLVGGVAIIDKQNTYICGLNTKLDNIPLPTTPGTYKLSLIYTNNTLLPNKFYVDVGFFESSGIVRLDYKSKINEFTIKSSDYIAEGVICLEHNWYVEEVSQIEV